MAGVSLPLRRVTLKDVAARGGVSAVTVSLALRNRREIPAQTRERLQALAQEMGYVADPAMSALAAYRTQQRVRTDYSTVAVVTNWPSRDSWSEGLVARQLMEGARARAQQLGYVLEHFWLAQPRLTGRRATEILFNRGIRGLLMAPLPLDCKEVDLDWKRFAVVTIEQPFVLPTFHHISPDYFAAMSIIWAELLQRGYRRIGLILLKRHADRVRHRFDAAHFFEQQQRCAAPDRVPTLYLNTENDEAAFRHWMEAHQPDVVVSKLDTVLRWLRAAKCSVPRDVGYVSMNVLDQQENVAGIDQQRSIMGALAIDALNALMLRGHRGPDVADIGTTVQGVWREGPTLRPRRS